MFRRTVLFMHLLNLEEESSSTDHIIVKLIQGGNCREFGTRNFCKRVKVNAIERLNGKCTCYRNYDDPVEGQVQPNIGKR